MVGLSTEFWDRAGVGIRREECWRGATGCCVQWKCWGLRWCRNKAWVLSLGWRGWNNKRESLLD